ncbi:hypothetical protein D3C78_1018690 [compost metagenome]
MLQQPEDRLGDEPEEAVVDGQFQARGQLLQVILALRTGVEGGGSLRLGAGRHVQRGADETDDVVALGVLAGLDRVVLVLVGDPGGHEVVLQPGNPATLYGFLEGLLVHVAHGHLLVRLIRCPDRGAQVGGDAGGGVGGRVGTGVTLELGIHAAGPGLGALVVDLVCHLQVVFAAGQGEALGVVDAGFAEGQVDHQLVLAVGQLELALGRAVERAAVGASIRAVGADETALGLVQAFATIVEQLEGHVRMVLATRVLRQGQLHDVAAVRVDSQVEDIGFNADQVAAGCCLCRCRLGALCTCGRHVVAGLGGCGVVRQGRGCAAAGAGACGRQGGLTVVLVPLENHQIGHDCQGDDQDRALNIHDYSAIEGGWEVLAGGTGS